MTDYKQAIIIRADLQMGKGKIAAQAAHASLEAYKAAKAQDVEEWESQGCKKITLKAEGPEQIQELYRKAKAAKLACALIRDAGHTQVEPGTITALAIGPVDESKVNQITGGLKLL